MNTATTTICPDVLYSGNCLKGEDCLYCQPILGVSLNVNAKGWVPKYKRTTDTNLSPQNESIDQKTSEKLKFNLNAEEYKPKPPQDLAEEIGNLNVDEGEEEEKQDEDGEEYDGEEFDMIMKDIINNEVMEQIIDDDESDDEKWFPKYKDCECCKGFVYKCQGAACVNMGTCYCKMKEECDEEEMEE
jgi:hypothetical protein